MSIDKSPEAVAHAGIRLEELTRRGASRREVLRAMAAGGLMSLTGAGLLASSGAAFAQQQAKPKQGGKIRVATQSSSSADTLDPAKGALGTDYVRANMFYNGLTELDPHLGAKMALAESLETKDATVWVVKLRSGVQFHDGKSLTPNDVVYSLMRHKDPAVASKAKTLADQIKEAKATGPNEVTITLEGANADLPVILATSHFLIVKDGTTDFKTAVGTGPFKLKEFAPGVRTVGVRNEKYWKPGMPHLDEVELIGIGDESARVNALLSGDVQLINAVSPRSTARIKGTPGFSVLETKTGQYTDLIMRDEGGITGTADFRRGLTHLMDREQIRRAVFLGYGSIGNDQPIDPTNKYYLKGLPQRPFDPEKAKFYFQKAKLGNAPVQLYASPAAEGSVEMAMLLQQVAPQAGLNLQVVRVPSDGYWSNHWMKHPLGYGNINARPSADVLFTQFFKSDAPWNEANWKNPKFDQMLVAARGEPDDAKRKQIYGDMQQLVHDDGGIGIPMFQSSLDAHSSKLKGLGSIPLAGLMGFMFAENVWLEA
ncbi:MULTISPECIES: ABC transporter substrate-binding protein [Paraburkholderia]|jgi:peptide/nickel transport system substrate-binding protein|uniref:ABC transporter substrate-binding protein n=3 Tax=Burkholderiaceae TaxID=119060 RepID=A0AAN1JH21_9BURK|nr:ABC transporter substrate-binding protein [Paraburkholderia hospita]SKC99911.1 peptide/nickel transport system substrate-binding protein [Burkholderia sp. CF099]AUT73888.1 ABC transporter substrate-binding protein [Paraburkholderia hospita]EIM97700.1 extracellular solute-binding protein [Paraburkholderia hospita]OUL93063.1 ABC transporter substrate-binding protein [Paraburkholderia hospita]SEH47607.1 peptide/nickel transport system substrate-binding protein [Paraburkholderia hospita]